MGLSSKQVSSSGINWNQTLLQDQNLEIPKPPLIRKLQQQQQQNQPQPQPQQSSTSSSEPLKCPRCDSTNTKFCYYNNYNKSQPRHFCRTCKRHWTKGGTLRNVPVGGGRKNKRVKKSNPNTSSSAAGGAQNQSPLQRQSTLSLPPSSASLYQALIRPPPPAAAPQSLNLIGNGGNGSFLSSSMPLVHQNQNFLFPFLSSSSFETNNNPSCSVSISTSLRSSSAVYNSSGYGGGGELKTTMEETTTTPVQQHGQPWEIPSTSVGVGGNNLEMSSYWSWEDIDSLVSTDLNVPWDDSDLKP